MLVGQIGFRGVRFNITEDRVVRAGFEREIHDLSDSAMKDYADRKIGVREKVANTDRCYRLIGQLTVVGVLTRA